MRSDLNIGFDPFLFAASEAHNKRMLSEFVQFFQAGPFRPADCQEVLDLATGRGHFLEILEGASLNCRGVDHDPQLVENGLARGLKMEQAGVLDYLATTEVLFDGIMASHIIEHMDGEDGLVPVYGGNNRLALRRYLRCCLRQPRTQMKLLAKRFFLYGFGFSFLLDDTYVVARKPAA